MESSQKEKAKTLISLLLAALFFASGALKWAGADMQVQNFERWGFPVWFLYLTGFFEVVGALLILKTSTRLAGVLLLGCVMLGATATHLFYGEFAMAAIPVVLLMGLAWVGASSRRPSLEESAAMEQRRQVQRQGHTL